MRETSVRVIAAVLMTGAIAMAMGLPSLFDPTQEIRRGGLTAPPSARQRTVPGTSIAATEANGKKGGGLFASPNGSAHFVAIGSTAGRAASAGLDAKLRASRARPISVPKPPHPPAPAPSPKPSTNPPASPPTPASPPAQTPTDDARQLTTTTPTRTEPQPAPGTKKGKGKAKGKGHGKSRGEPAEVPVQVPQGTTPAGPATASGACDQADAGKVGGDGHGNGRKDKDHVDGEGGQGKRGG